MQELKFLKVIAVAILFAGYTSPSRAEDSPPINFEEVEWQSATLEDLQFFEPYIGTFRSPSYTADGSGKEFYFTITYDWYNTAKSVIKWTIHTHIPADDVVRVNGEGFYGYDFFENRIFVNGFFPSRPAGGFGWISDFDTETNERVVRIHSKAPDGQVTQVRDTFYVIDENSWRNITYVSVNGGDWQEISNGVYTRVEG